MRAGATTSRVLRIPMQGDTETSAALRRVATALTVLGAVTPALVVSLVFLASSSWLLRGAAIASALLLAFGVVATLRRFFRRVSHLGPALAIGPEAIALHSKDGTCSELLPVRDGFGITLLVSAGRDRVVAALTAQTRVLCVGAQVLPKSALRKRLDALLPFAATAPAEDLEMATVLPNGVVLVLDAASWLALLDRLLRMDPGALDRCYLTDAGHGQVALTAERLRTSKGTVRFDRPFEWRAWVFHEGGQGYGASFHATAVRQGRDEFVFVCLAGTDVWSSIREGPGGPRCSADRFLLRDATLIDTPIGLPPPRDRRIAIDRLFMLPLRRVLDRACRVNRPSVPGDASAP